MRGLLGRRGLPAGEGLLLRPAPSIHTAFMRFPIDALFLDRELRVLDIRESLPPWRVASKPRARAVLELAAGECARRGVQVGDRLELRDRTAAGLIPSDAPETVNAPTLEPREVSSAQWTGDELTRLRPLRVLVLSPDHKFRSVMSLLLARRNCSVTSTTNPSRVSELALREKPDVVVIDAGELDAAAAVAKLEALGRSLGVVFVADDPRSQEYGSPALAKWGPFEDLLTAIERADGERQSLGSNGDQR
jgi:uncharacterized membrane protein (UPF0127 family)/CheY-like chemotaxis protein